MNALQFPDFNEMGIRSLRVENLIGPKQGDHVARPGVLDGVGEAGRDVHDLDGAAVHGIFDDLLAEDMAETNNAFSPNHAKLFDLRIVIMIASRDTWPGLGNKHLAGLPRFDQLEKPAAIIGLELHWMCQVSGVAKGKVGGMESL